MTTDVVGILLAAGQGRRFGGRKLLQPFDDAGPVGVRAARNLLDALPASIAVVAADDAELDALLRGLGCRVIHNRQPELGMSHSLALAVAATADGAAWVVALGDMPWIKPQTIAAVAAALRAGASLVAPAYQGQRGHPVGLAGSWRSQLLANRGDQGARAILSAHAQALRLLPMADPGILRDVDTPADLEGAAVPRQ